MTSPATMPSPQRFAQHLSGRVLAAAADVIETNGWQQGAFVDHDAATCVGVRRAPVCVVGAIRIAAGGEPDAETETRSAIRAERHVLGWLVDHDHHQPNPHGALPVCDELAVWNDQPDRTAEQVVEALRAAAETVRGLPALLAEVRRLRADAAELRDGAQHDDTLITRLIADRDQAREVAVALEQELARVHGYAEQLAKSDNPAHADHGQALLALLDGGERPSGSHR